MFTRIVIVVWLFYQPAVSQTLAKGDSARENGNYSSAIAFYNEVLQRGLTLPPLDSGNLFMRRGICFFETNNREEALNDYFFALKIFERLGNNDRLAAINTNIARVYAAAKDYTNTEKYRKRSLDLFVENKDSFHVAFVMNDLAVLYAENNRYQDAIQLHTEALTNYKTVMNDHLLVRHLYNIGNCFESDNQDSCLHYYRQAEKVAIKAEDSAMLSVIYSSMGESFKAQGNTIQAITYFERSLQLNEQFGKPEELAIIYRNLADAYYDAKVPDKSRYFSLKEREFNRRLYDIGKTRIAAELSEKYESDKKDEKIRTQEIESDLKSRNLVLSLIGFLLAAGIAVISYISFRKKRKANYLLQLQNDRIEKLNKELDASNQVKSKLFSVISHDIRGPISSIYAHLHLQNAAQDNKPGQVYIHQTEELLETLEDLLVWSKSQLHQFVPTYEKIDVRQLFDRLRMLLEGSITNKNLALHVNVQKGLMVRTDLNMLTIIIRNILSNAIENSPPHSSINVSAENSITSTIVSISNICDNFGSTSFLHDYPSSVTSSTSGLGITLVNEFTGKLGGSIEYNVLDNRVIARLTLPAS